MIVFINGKFVPEEQAVVSVFDRGFLYGDGLFEGMLIHRGEPFRWEEHMVRLQCGVEFLKLTVPYDCGDLLVYARRLIKRNRMKEGMLRLSLSRGITGRTYSPKNAKLPSVIMTVHPLPESAGKNLRWQLVTSTFRLPAGDPLAQFKTANKLPQVLARAEADAAGAQEAILLNTDGHIAEGTTCNVFWIRDNIVYTPPLPSSALAGVTRAIVLQLCQGLSIRTKEVLAGPSALLKADGVFLTMTSMGIVEAESLDDKRLKRSPVVKRLQEGYLELLK